MATEKTNTLARRDLVFYRLLALFAYAIIAIVGLSIINRYDSSLYNVFSKVYFKIPMAVLVIAAIVAMVIKVGKNKVIRLCVVAGVIAPLFLMLALYTNITNYSVKIMAVIIASIVVGFIFIVYPKNFFYPALLVVVDYLMIYYLYRAPINTVDIIIRIIAYPVSFIIPIIGICYSILSIRGKELNIGKYKVVKKNNKKLSYVLLLALSIILLITAILSFFIPGYYSFVWYILLSIIIIVGIICTVKML